MKRLDLEGKRFGSLTVIRYSHSYTQPSKQKRAMWVVKCECGIEQINSVSSLISGQAISCVPCGIKRGNLKRRKGIQRYLNDKYLSYKNRAKKKNLSFLLSKNEFQILLEGDCIYCGEKPILKKTHPRYIKIISCNTIDRKDSQLGYTLDNSVSCCWRCNTMKLNMTEEIFREQICKIYNYLCLYNQEKVKES